MSSSISTMVVGFGWTISTKPYESFRVDVSLTANLDPEDDVDEVYDDLVKKIKEKIELQVKEAME